MRGPPQKRISGYLKDFTLGREKGRPHRRFTGADCLSRLVSQSPCLTSLIMHTSQTAPEILHRERGEEAGFYTLSCLNNDAGATNRGAHYSPRSFGSWPAASLVRAPVSNDPCQRLPRTAVMTYHTSSLRPHTDSYNHIYSFCCRIRPLL